MFRQHYCTSHKQCSSTPHAYADAFAALFMHAILRMSFYLRYAAIAAFDTCHAIAILIIFRRYFTRR